MSKRELTPEREKKRQNFQAKNAPESNSPPSEDSPEQDVVPEFERAPLETEGETTELLNPPKSKRKNLRFRRRYKKNR